MKNSRLILWLALTVILVTSASGLTLKESLDFAMKNNPSVVAGAKKVQAAEARLSQAVGTFLPTIKLDGNYSQSYTQPSTVQFTVPSSSGAVTQNLTFGTEDVGTINGWQASLNQPIFVAALFPALKIAQRTTDSAKADYQKTVLDMSFNVTQAYVVVIASERMLKLAQESKEMAASHLNQVTRMEKVGVATLSDRLRSEVQLANAEVALTKALNGLEMARNSFNNVLGQKMGADIVLSEEGFSLAINQLPEYEVLVTEAFKNRPDWQQYVYGLEIGQENVRVAQSAYLPIVMLNGQAGNRQTVYPSYRTDVNSWAVTGTASWTLFDGLGMQNRVKEAGANLEAQKATEEQVKNNIELEIRDAYLNLISAVDSLGSAKKAVFSATENYKVYTQRYASGAGTNIELLDAQVSLTQAQVNHLKAMFDVVVGKAKINKVVAMEVLKL